MHKVFSGVIWKALQQYSSYVIKIAVQVILARLLLPKDFGLIAELLVFVAIAEVLANSGLGTALVQKKDADDLDFSSVFVGSELFALCLYLILFLSAPMIGRFYREPLLPNMLRVSGWVIFFNVLNSIQCSYLFKQYHTKPIFTSTFIGNIIAGIIAVGMAYNGFGAWSLVVQIVLSSALSVIILQLLIDWKPIFVFSKRRFGKLFSFSWKVLVSNLLGMTLENVYNLTIGRYYSADTLGYYNRGNTFPSALIGQLRVAVNSLTLPMFAEKQDSHEAIVTSLHSVTHLSVLAMFPLAAWLAAIATPFIRLLLTERWLPCVFFMRLECVFYGVLPIASSLGNAIIAKGRSDINMYIEATKLCMVILCVALLHGFDVKILCIARTLIAVVITFYSVMITKRLIGYSFKALIEDIWKPLLLSLFMGAVVYCVEYFGLNDIITLLLQTIIGFVVYVAGVYLFMKEDFLMVKNICMQMLGKTKAVV